MSVSIATGVSSLDVLSSTGAAAVVGAAGGVPANVTVDTEGSASENVVALQASLDAGGTVSVLRPGTVWINDTVLIGENTTLIMGPQTTLKLVGGANKLMLANKALFRAATTVTVAWTSGSLATVTWAGHGLVLGDAIVMQGATEVNWNRVYRVNSITDADTFTIRLPFVATAAPTGTTTAKRCERNIKVTARMDFNKTGGNSTGSGYNRIMSMWAFIADSDIDVTGADGYKYMASISGFANTEIKAAADPNANSNSDVLKIYGPGRGLSAKVSGAGPEDILSVQPKEPAAFIAYMPCFGPVDGVTIDKVDAHESDNGSGGFVVYSDDAHLVDNIVIQNGELSSINGHGLKITNGSGFSPASAFIRSVRAENLRISAQGATNTPFFVESKVRHLVVKSCDLVPHVDTQSIFKTSGSATIDLLEFHDLELNILDWPSTGTRLAFDFGGSLNHVIYRGCSFRGVQARTRLMLIGANAIKKLTFVDCEFENLDQLCQVAASTTNGIIVTFRGCRVRNCNTGVNPKAPANIYLSDSVFDTMTNGVVRSEGVGTAVNVYGGNGCTFTSATAIVCVSSGTAVPYGANLPVDIGATGITKAAGASCFNTGTGRGTIPQNRPVVCDGTNWLNATNLSHTF